MAVCIVPTLIIGIVFTLILIVVYLVWMLIKFILERLSKFMFFMRDKAISFCGKIRNNKLLLGQIFFLLLILFAGVIVELKDITLLYVEKLPDISIAVVTVQATIFTLVVALLALVSGHNDIYLGVEIKRFYFNHMTFFIPQKHMMYIGIFLILSNTILLYFEWYNIVFSIFVISLWLIFGSVVNVMRIYSGTNRKFKENVRAYIRASLLKRKKMDEIYKNLVEDWISKIPIQGKNADDEYYCEFCELYKQILKENGENNGKN